MNEDEKEELDNETDPQLDEGFGTYEDVDITPDDEPEEEPEDETESKDNSDDENKAKQIEQEVKQKAQEGMKTVGKKVGKAAGKGFMSMAKFLFTPPILWFTIIALVAILLVGIIALSVMGGSGGAPYGNVNPTNGQFGTSMGITGDKFYGARAIYYNPEQAKLDLADYYHAFGEDFLESIDAMEHVDLNVNVNVEDVTPELSKLIAKAVSGSTEDLTLEQYLSLIDHFGYTNIELDNIQVGFVNYVLDNQSTLLTIEEGYSTLETDLNNTFDTKYSSYNVTAPLYYAKDMILEESKEAMIPSEEARDFVAMIYMPRTSVTLKETSYMFYFPEDEESQIAGYATSVAIQFATVVNGEHNLFVGRTADSSWWKDGSAEITADEPNINISLSQFASIDLDNPLNNVNLYSLMLDANKELVLDTQNETASFENLNKYFSNTLIEDNETGENYYQISYLPKDLNYYYLRFEANGVFQFCEFETVFE